MICIDCHKNNGKEHHPTHVREHQDQRPLAPSTHQNISQTDPTVREAHLRRMRGLLRHLWQQILAHQHQQQVAPLAQKGAHDKAAIVNLPPAEKNMSLGLHCGFQTATTLI